MGSFWMLGKEMKVALELQPCCGNRSGIGNYTYELAKRLQNENGLSFSGNIFNFLRRHDNHIALSGISMPIREQPCMSYGIYRRIWNWLPFRYEKLFSPADLTIFFNYIVPPKVTGKVISVIYDMTYLRYPETMNRNNIKRLREGLSRSIIASDHIVTISKFSQMEISQLLKVPKEMISVVPCAPSLSKEYVSFDTLVKERGICQPFILCVGTIEPRKNLSRLIRAFTLLKREYKIPHQLVLAGGKGWNNEEIYRSAKASPYSSDILFTGFISDEEKNTLYRHADVFVFPSLYEGFGLPPLEAMACGCPIVCSSVASLPEIMGEAGTFVDPLDENSIVDGVWKVLSDKVYTSEMIRRGYDQAKKFTWEASAKKLKRICREVLS